MTSDPRSRSFFDLYAHDFARLAVAVPRVALADPARNAREVERLYRAAVADGVAAVVFPELSLAGYSLDDLHQQEALLGAVRDGVAALRAATRESGALLVVGAPLAFRGRLFNCAVVLSGGRVLGVVPKSYLPSYREFYEKRQFAAARDASWDAVELAGDRAPFGADLVFRCEELPHLAVAAEICEDLWVPVPPSTRLALAGATVIANLSASNATVGKWGYRLELAASHSAKCIAATLFAGAGTGESTTDLAWDGQGMIHENGELLAQTERFAEESQLLAADVDLGRLVQDRMRMTSFADCAADHREALRGVREVPFSFAPASECVRLRRAFGRRPFVPAEPERRDERCREVFQVQVAGLVQRLRATGIERPVVGVSGGLDSTLALLVAAEAADRMDLPRSKVIGCTMPGYATSKATLGNARGLMQALGVTALEHDVRPACDRMLAELDHPYARGEAVYDLTFENVQAGERTSYLFRLANRHDGLVVGTSDLSELALGWCTYGVGDQMAHYSVNSSIPKTLVRHLIDWVAGRDETREPAERVLRAILGTAISPELVPGVEGEIAQRTEEILGPFELHDFSLYYVTRRGYGPAKVAWLAAHAFAEGGEDETAYSLDDVLRWLEVFLDRFFRTSQFKRSALPNGPKVGSGGSLSPRGDWRAPSDSSSAPWLAELRAAREWAGRSSG